MKARPRDIAPVTRAPTLASKKSAPAWGERGRAFESGRYEGLCEPPPPNPRRLALPLSRDASRNRGEAAVQKAR
eukprot:1202277-Prymnesium_polylepis.1